MTRTSLFGRKCYIPTSKKEYTFLEFQTAYENGKPYLAAVIETEDNEVGYIEASCVTFLDKF